MVKAKPPTAMAKDEKSSPALFATIHFRSSRRPNGYSDDEIVALNKLANQPQR